MVIKKEYWYKCYICNRQTFPLDLQIATVAMADYLMEHFAGESSSQFKLCDNFNQSQDKNKRIPNTTKRIYDFTAIA